MEETVPGSTTSSEEELQRRYWRLAATLFLSGALGSAASLAFDPSGHPPIYLMSLPAAISAAVCWLIAEDVPRRWLHLMTAVAALEVAYIVGFGGATFTIYYALIAIYAAYVFRSRREVAAHVAFASLLALAPVVYEPSTGRETVSLALALIPTIVVAAGAVVFLRERLEASETRFRLLAQHDPLTGAGNHRMLAQLLPAELARHQRRGSQLAFALLDLDDFKRINDDNGHKFGDSVLQEVAAALTGASREGDVVIRYGGDEFAVIAPDTDAANALLLSRRLTDAIEEVEVGGCAIGACAGVAVYPADGRTVDELFSVADAELMRAKQGKPERSRGARRDPAPARAPAPAHLGT